MGTWGARRRNSAPSLRVRLATDRTVRPLGLWFWGKVWTLIAWCDLRDDFRMFRIDRVADIETLEEIFRPERGKTIRDFYRRMEERGDVPARGNIA